MRYLVSTLAQLAGVAALAIAGFTIDPAAGFAAIGVGLIAVGTALERR